MHAGGTIDAAYVSPAFGLRTAGSVTPLGGWVTDAQRWEQ